MGAFSCSVGFTGPSLKKILYLLLDFLINHINSDKGGETMRLSPHPNCVL